MIRRILQMLLSSFVGQALAILSQLIVPPLFIRLYGNGLAVYGEWIALSASVTYLTTLNYGIQTYTTNQMTILFGRGDIQGGRVVQASAFRLLLLLNAAFAVLGLVVFAIPVASLLKLTTVSSRAASLTLYLLVLQFGLSMLLSLLTNSYMAIGKLHRGYSISNIQRLFLIAGMAVLLILRSSFVTLAAFQLLVLLVFIAVAVIDVRRTDPNLMPALSAGSWAEVKQILKPSWHFFLISVSGFMTWQAPILLIQRMLGADAVGVFSLVRVVFQMSRQILLLASSMLGQDITLMVGRREWRQLRRLYDLSERLVLFLIPIVTIGSLMMCPFLFTIWLHKRGFYQPVLCILMAMVSAVLGLKEHKMQFQQSWNEQEKVSTVILVGYSTMLLASIPVMWRYGLSGFLATWLLWEIVQTAIVVRLNVALFPEEHRSEVGMMRRFIFFMLGAFALVGLPAKLEGAWPLWESVAAAIVAVCVLGGVAYAFFDLDELRVLLFSRWKNRAVPAAPAA